MSIKTESECAQAVAGNLRDFSDLWRQLLVLKNEIEALAESSSESRQAVELDQASVGRLSRIDAMQRQAMAMAAQRRRQTELLRIRAALQRMDDGEYGYCSVCGCEIASARLEIDPATSTCVSCTR